MKTVNAVISSGVMSCDINSDMDSSFQVRAVLRRYEQLANDYSKSDGSEKRRAEVAHGVARSPLRFDLVPPWASLVH